VIRTRVGYAGGTTKSPTYQAIGDHTETLQVDYDPTKLGYEQLLAVFWDDHSPTSPAFSRQYKAAIFTHDEEQARLAQETKAAVAKRLGRAVTTEVLPFTGFTRAEDYHQKYSLRHSPAGREVLARTGEGAPFTDSTAAARLNGYVAGHGDAAQLEAELPRLGLSDELGRRLLAELRARGGKAGPGCR
jgi:peptide-methionine (S)-S-oxide reductase